MKFQTANDRYRPKNLKLFIAFFLFLTGPTILGVSSAIPKITCNQFSFFCSTEGVFFEKTTTFFIAAFISFIVAMFVVGISLRFRDFLHNTRESNSYWQEHPIEAQIIIDRLNPYRRNLLVLSGVTALNAVGILDLQALSAFSIFGKAVEIKIYLFLIVIIIWTTINLINSDEVLDAINKNKDEKNTPIEKSIYFIVMESFIPLGLCLSSIVWCICAIFIEIYWMLQ